MGSTVERTQGALEAALRRHVEVLAMEIGPRTPLRAGSLARAADYIHAAFQEVGLEVTEQAYEYHGQRVANVIATPPGSVGASAYYVIGAHYDTVPGTPGADDNASAVAVLLELARRLHETSLSVPVQLVAFTLEEAPASMTRHRGSRVFVRACRSAGHIVAAALVLEMVGYTAPRQRYPLVLRWAGYPDRGDFIGIVGNRRSRRFGRLVVEGFRENPRLPVESLFVPFNGGLLPATRMSDHLSFWEVGWPALMVTDTAFFRNPNYHLPSDSPDTLDFGWMAELVRSLLLALSKLPPIP